MDIFFSAKKINVVGSTPEGKLFVENLGSMAGEDGDIAIVADDTDISKLHAKACIISRRGERIRGAGMRVIGPDSLGIIDNFSGMNAAAINRGRCRIPKKGKVSFVCNYSRNAMMLLDAAAGESVGMSKFVSIGMTDICDSGAIEFLEKDSNTSVICLWLQAVHDGRKLYELLKNCTKTVVAFNEHGKIFGGMLEQSGAIEAHSLEELLDMAKAFELYSFAGDRVCIISQVKENFPCTSLSVHASRELARAGIEPSNPLTADLGKHADALKIISEDPEIDMIIYRLSLHAAADEKIADNIIAASKKKPVVVSSCGGTMNSIINEILSDKGIAVYPTLERALRTVFAINRQKLYK